MTIASPAPEVAAPAAPAPDNSGVNWDALASEVLADGSPASEETPPPNPDPAAAPASASPAPAAPAAPPTPGQPPAAPTPPVDPAAVAKAAADARTRIHGELAGIYAKELDEDTKAALIADPASVMPKLLAQAALDGAQLAFRQITDILPDFINRASVMREGHSKVWTEFNAAHPDLSKPEFRQAVVAAISAVKASGQKPATKEAAMASVARTARAMLGMPEGASAPAAEPAPAAPVAPHTPVARGHAAPRAPAKSDNPWLELMD